MPKRSSSVDSRARCTEQTAVDLDLRRGAAKVVGTPLPPLVYVGVKKDGIYVLKDTLVLQEERVNHQPYYASERMHVYYGVFKPEPMGRGGAINYHGNCPHGFKERAEWVISKMKPPEDTRPFGRFLVGVLARNLSKSREPLDALLNGTWMPEGNDSHLVSIELTDKLEDLQPPIQLLSIMPDNHEGQFKTSEEEDLWKCRLRIKSLLVALGKTKSGQQITVRDLLQNVDGVKQHLAELLEVFPQVDQDGDGKITAEDLEAFFTPRLQQYYSQQELDKLWAGLTKGLNASGSVSLSDMAKPQTYEWANANLPEVIDHFADIDTDRDCLINRKDFDAFFGNVDVWLTKKLSHIVGMEQLKAQIQNFYWSVRLDQERRKAGLFVNQDEAIVIVFKGGPGTGKTTFGRLIAELLFKIGIIQEKKFVEVQREALVGAVIGETEKKAEAVISDAHGGLLFVDEAYRLHVKGSEKDFGQIAITTLMKAMTVKGKVIILAGYPQEMSEFVAVNAGIKRRITYEFTFDDYTPKDLAEIVRLQVSKRGFVLANDITDRALAELITVHTSQTQRANFNAGLCEHIARNAIASLNAHVVGEIYARTLRGEPAPPPTITLCLHHLLKGICDVPGGPIEASRSSETPHASVSLSKASPESKASSTRGFTCISFQALFDALWTRWKVR